MSDRYETPSWGDEPDDLATRSPVAGERRIEPGASRSPRWESRTSTRRARTSSTAGPRSTRIAAPAEDESSGDAAPPGDASDFRLTQRLRLTQLRRRGNGDRSSRHDDLTEAPVPLADHVSDSVEHAPGELTVPPGYSVLEGIPSGERRAVGIVVARFNGDVTTRLLESALAELEERGVSRDSVTVMPVPGAFELPLAAMALAKTRRFACIVALGCVIRGDTPHFDYVSSEAASGLQLAAIETGVPVAFGVLTLDRADQADSRVGKGAEAVLTGLEMADLFANLRAAAAR